MNEPILDWRAGASARANPTLVLNVVGLTPGLIGEHTPNLQTLVRDGALRALRTITPAVTCSVQSTFLTGVAPSEHGIVGNGWYFRELGEIMAWRQSNHLVQAPKIWDRARAHDPSFSVAQMFWWYNMYANVDWAATPRPMYPADGRKLPDIHTHPGSLRGELQGQFGQFPLFHFWGPMAGIQSSSWIARATLEVMRTRSPALTLCYLPHLDYDLQRLGPDDPRILHAASEVDSALGPLLAHARAHDMPVIVVSEYAITPVRGAIAINRHLRRAGLIAIRDEMGRELLDAGASEAFAFADHQLAHIYVRNPERVAEVEALVAGIEGIDRVVAGPRRAELGLDHPRSGEIIALSRPDRWFSYYYWLDDERAPDFARCVDIHRKPGYDPVELVLDPRLRAPKLKVARRLIARKLGFRNLLDVIGLDSAVVRGSHGRVHEDPERSPVFVTNRPQHLPDGPWVAADEVCTQMLRHLYVG